MSRRLEILNGKLHTPQQIRELVNHSSLDDMFQSLWHNYLIKPNTTTSVAYWSDRFNDNKAFNTALYHLSKAGWTITNIIPARNWGTLQLDTTKLHQWVSEPELLHVRRFHKFHKYLMTNTLSTENTLTKTPQGIQDVGITRTGIAKSGNTSFQYDTKYLSKYYDTILTNTVKGMTRALEKHPDIALDEANYLEVATELLEYYLHNDGSYTLGNSLSDSRGRAISSSLAKGFNPIGYKDARALLVGPNTTLGMSGRNQVYLFVAELLGYKALTLEAKAENGRQACHDRELHTLDLDKESDRDELHENIWLERIYDNLDTYTGSNWTVPIELDATASMIQVEGVLLNDYKMLDETNVVNSDHLKDIWSKGMPRKQFKTATTPLLYGSSQECTALWAKAGITYTTEHIALHRKELASGAIGTANKFKDYIIDNVQPTPQMKVQVWNEEFTVYCNKYRSLGDYMKKYPSYDTATDSVLTINHTHTRTTPDLEQFRRYFVTLLVHNLDSQLADRVAGSLDWCLPIYDAFIVMPVDALQTRTVYAQGLDDMYTDREAILSNYFTSIGIKPTVGAQKQWNLIVERTQPITDFKAQLSALK